MGNTEYLLYIKWYHCVNVVEVQGCGICSSLSNCWANNNNDIIRCVLVYVALCICVCIEWESQCFKIWMLWVYIFQFLKEKLER